MYPKMAEYHTEAVAQALDCLSDANFTPLLSNQDRRNLSDFIALCEASYAMKYHCSPHRDGNILSLFMVTLSR